MKAATSDITKRKRPPQAGEPVLVRLQPEQLAALDTWRDGQHDAPSRPEAVRRLLQTALATNA